MGAARYPFVWVDAFTDRGFVGNPCAVLTAADGLDEPAMQVIAAEFHLSETAFVFPSHRADYAVRFFTPLKEVPLAGHPTIAVAHALLELGRVRGPRFHQELAVGVLPVEVDAEGVIWMTQQAPTWGRQAEGPAVAAALGLTPAELLPGQPVQVVSTGTPQLMVPLRTAAALDAIRVDAPALAALEGELGAFSTHCFALLPDGTVEARHFAPAAGIAEDPFTGSATGGMGAYLVSRGLARGPRLAVRQGRHVGRPGRGWVGVAGEQVRVGGQAVTVARGEIDWG